jgi:hypothetical protein
LNGDAKKSPPPLMTLKTLQPFLKFNKNILTSIYWKHGLKSFGFLFLFPSAPFAYYLPSFSFYGDFF